MANQRTYTTAYATLALNIGLALLLLAASAVSALIHRPLHDSAIMSVVVAYSGGIIFFFVLSLLFPAGLTNPMQVLGDLLCALQIPTALQQNNRRTGLCIAGGTLLLWIPAALITQFPDNEPVLYGVIFFLAFWIIFFRALYYAEQQTPCPITTRTDLKQQQKQTYALLLLAGLVCGFGTLPLLLQLAYRLLASETQLAQTGNLFFLGILAAIGLVTVIILAILYRRHCRQMNAALEKLQLEHQVTQSQLYVDLLSQKYDTLRRYQHDFKQHLAHIQQLAQQDQTAAITAYISAIYDDLQNAAPLKLTGNQTLDLLLGDKLQQAQAQGVSPCKSIISRRRSCSTSLRRTCASFWATCWITPSLRQHIASADKSAVTSGKKMIITPPSSLPTAATGRRKCATVCRKHSKTPPSTATGCKIFCDGHRHMADTVSLPI